MEAPQPEHGQIIVDEEAILEATLQSIRHYRGKRDQEFESLQSRFEQIRSELADAQESDLAHLSQQLNQLRAIAERSKPSPLPDMGAPYFAHLVLKEKPERVRHILLGFHSFVGDGSSPPIIDWRHAPIARIFFTYREGEEYEEELPGKVISGIVMSRRVIGIKNSKLQEISGSFGTLRMIQEKWQFVSNPFRLQGGQQSAIRGGQLTFGSNPVAATATTISALLDKNQYELLTADPDSAILISGHAGSGKTTVAIHRLAYLIHENPSRFNKKSIFVVIPTHGLVGLYKNLIASMRIEGFKAHLYESWIEGVARRVVKGLPKQVDEDPPPVVTDFKRSRFALQLVDNFVANLRERFLRDLRQGLQLFPEEHARLFVTHVSFFDGANAIVQACRGGSGDLTAADRIWEKFQESFADFFGFYVEMMTDGDLLSQTLAPSPWRLQDQKRILKYHGEHMLPQKIEAELQDDDVLTADGQRVSDYLKETESESINPEDFSLCLVLWQQIYGRSGTLANGPRYEHIFIDEVQEFAPVELRVLSLMHANGQGYTISGDFFQKISDSGLEQGWGDVKGFLGVSRHQSGYLETNYRSPQEIAELAWDVLQIPVERRPKSVRTGGPVFFTSYPHCSAAMIALIDQLTLVLDREPLASIAVVARKRDVARQIFEALKVIPEARDAIGGDFKFRPGIDVTVVEEVKGLEFDYVILPDCDAFQYRDEKLSRQALHMAMTRAMHQLWLLCVGTPSPILPERITASN
jgi:DNA helicase-2/ATP-dependent DNA helicase PcrA